MKHNRAKQIVYHFNGNPMHDEIVSDRIGGVPFRRVGEIVKIRGKEWLVNVVQNNFDMLASRPAIPIHRVFLTDRF
jgi:hypothetical protein